MILDKIKNRFIQKAVRYLFSIQYNKPKYSLINDEYMIKEAYHKIVWCYACVSMISSAVSNVPWLLYEKDKNGELIEVDQHPILNLLNEKVNENLSSRDFFDMWSTYLACNGKFYAVFDSPINPTMIEPLIPYYTKVIPDIKEFYSGLNYNISGVETDYSKNLCLWSRFIDPVDFYEGLSPIRALARILDTENSAVDWNKSNLDNAGIPAGALSVESPTEEQILDIRKKWKENYQGPTNTRMPLIIDSEKAKYINFGFTPVEMDFILQKKVNRIEICSGFGVPSQIVGDPEGQTYSNYGEAVQAFWKNTVIPKYLNHIKSILNLTLKPKFLGLENYMIDYSLDNIDVLSESQNDISDRILNMWNNDFITLNEGRQVLGWERLEYGDNLKSKVLSEIMMEEEPNQDLLLEENPEEEPPKEGVEDEQFTT